MKSLIIAAIVLFSTLMLNAQCKDVFGKPRPCPVEQDSLDLYNNAIKVDAYYRTNPNYLKTDSIMVLSEMDKLDVYTQLISARKMYFAVRRSIPWSFKFKDVEFKDYYQKVSDIKFNQRELENQMVNINAPISMYDIRIIPTIINKYRCSNTEDMYYGDLVNIPMYEPIMVKPDKLLTNEERKIRYNRLGLVPPKYQLNTTPIVWVKPKTYDSPLGPTNGYIYGPAQSLIGEIRKDGKEFWIDYSTYAVMARKRNDLLLIQNKMALQIYIDHLVGRGPNYCKIKN
jgi:hypothetical protein